MDIWGMIEMRMLFCNPESFLDLDKINRFIREKE